MARNPKDICPVKCRSKACGKSIQSDPSHFDGVPASPETMLRCVLYEMFVLASSAQAMQTKWPDDLTFDHPKLGPFTPSESLKIAALISFRILYDFLYNVKSDDDFTADDFKRHGGNRPKEPTFAGFEPGKMFTKESINKYIAHLTWARINKPKCVPQPKFKEGDEDTISNAKILLKDARAFVSALIDTSNPKRVILDKDGQGYQAMFDHAYAQLLAPKRPDGS